MLVISPFSVLLYFLQVIYYNYIKSFKREFWQVERRAFITWGKGYAIGWHFISKLPTQRIWFIWSLDIHRSILNLISSKWKSFRYTVGDSDSSRRQGLKLNLHSDLSFLLMTSRIGNDMALHQLINRLPKRSAWYTIVHCVFSIKFHSS